MDSVLFILRIPPKEKSTNTSPCELFRPVKRLFGCRNQMVFISWKARNGINPQTQPSYGSGPCLAKLDGLARETEGSLFQPLLAGTRVKNAARPAL